MLEKPLSMNVLKTDLFSCRELGVPYSSTFLVGTRRGGVYLFWFLRHGTGSALCQPPEIGRTSGRTVRQQQYDPRGAVKARQAYAQTVFVSLFACLLA